MNPLDTQLWDAYVKKTVDLSLPGVKLTFSVSQTLFSSHQVDVGTVHLLKSLVGNLQAGPLSNTEKILDLGCGYGPIGVTLGHLRPTSQIHMVDRDALALAFARHNAVINGVADVTTYGSLGYDDVATCDFDLIVSNIPGKAGAKVIQALLLDAYAYLADEGTVAVVVVSPLEDQVLATLTRPDIEILRHDTLAAHAIFHYRFTAPGPDDILPRALDRGVYDRETITFTVGDLESLPVQTAYGLPEFDTLSYETLLLVKAMQEFDSDDVEEAVVFNPGQGHVPLLLWQLIAPQTVHLVDRDLLSLRYARQNLADNGCGEEDIAVHHQVALVPAGVKPDLVVGVLREDEGPEVIEQALVQAATSLSPDGHVLIAGGSTPITRVLKSKVVGRFLRVVKRKRHKGNSTALFERR